MTKCVEGTEVGKGSSEEEWIRKINVKAKYRRRGYGSEMLKSLEKSILIDGHTTVFVVAYPDIHDPDALSKRAVMQFYRRNGYEPVASTGLKWLVNVIRFSCWNVEYVMTKDLTAESKRNEYETLFYSSHSSAALPTSTTSSSSSAPLLAASAMALSMTLRVMTSHIRLRTMRRKMRRMYCVDLENVGGGTTSSMVMNASSSV